MTHAPVFRQVNAERGTLTLGCSCRGYVVTAPYGDAGVAFGQHVVYHQVSGAGPVATRVPAAPVPPGRTPPESAP